MSGYTGYALRFISGKYQGNEFPLKADYEVILGRGSELEIVLMEDMVSRHHAKIITGSDYVLVQDLGSTNGTFVNGERIRKIRLREGDRILIGTSILKLVPYEGELPVEEPAQQAPKMLPPPSSSPSSGALIPPALPSSTGQLGPAAPSSGSLSAMSVPTATKKLPAFGAGQSPSSPSSMGLPSAPPSLDFGPSSSSSMPASNADPFGMPASSADPFGGPLFDGPPPASSPAPSTAPPAALRTGSPTQLPKCERPELGQPLMTGTLVETPLSELIDLFANSRRNGVLVIDNGAQHGRLHLRDGRLIYAVLDDYYTIESRPSAIRILRWQEGQYALYAPFDQAIQEETNEDLNMLLQEARRSFDAIKKFHQDIPPSTQSLSIPVPLESPLKDLRPAHLEMFQLILNTGDINAVLGLSALGDVETYQNIAFLVRQQYVYAH